MILTKASQSSAGHGLMVRRAMTVRDRVNRRKSP
jgi:hypothetical protein